MIDGREVMWVSDGEDVVLPSGHQVVLRPVLPADAALIGDGFSRLGEESRYRRFFMPLSELSAQQLEFLSRVDHHDHEAIGAITAVDGLGVGVARYIRSPDRPDHAEVAVTVVDEWQGRGVGRVLLACLADRARSEGIGWFTADTLAVNAPMLHLLRALGPTSTDAQGATVTVRVDLTPGAAS